MQHVPSELKKELEKELDLLRSENQRLRSSYESLEIEKNKWRVLVIVKFFANIKYRNLPNLMVLKQMN